MPRKLTNKYDVVQMGDTPGFWDSMSKRVDQYLDPELQMKLRAEKEENLWISFPSSDRNKIKKEDFIILKKQIDLEKSVTVENKFKIIDIQNSAPEFIRAKYVEIGFMNETQLSSSVTASLR